MKKIKAISVLRVLSEIMSITLFIILLITKKLQFWIIIFGVTAVLAVIFGRFYCSWICPMNSAFRGINWIYTKLKISRLKTPKLLKHKVVRIILLILFIASMIVIKKLNLKVNMLFYVTLFSIFVTLIFEEKLWHRRLCPFGTILSFSSRKARLSLIIDEQACIACGKCQKVCPTSSIETLENMKRKNSSHECLLCSRCIEVCPTSACKYIIKKKVR